MTYLDRMQKKLQSLGEHGNKYCNSQYTPLGQSGKVRGLSSNINVKLLCVQLLANLCPVCPDAPLCFGTARPGRGRLSHTEPRPWPGGGRGSGNRNAVPDPGGPACEKGPIFHDSRVIFLGARNSGGF